MLENNQNDLEENAKKETIETTSTETIENSVSESASEDFDYQGEDTSVEPEEKMPDYGSMKMEELVAELSKLMKSQPIQDIKGHVEAIKSNFNSKFDDLLNQKKEAFLEEGGDLIDFQFSSPVKTDYNKLISDYKSKRNTHYKQIERELNENLDKRNQVIEDLKTLIDNANPDTMYNDFQQLQTRWKSIGNVPNSRYNDTWKIYHHHVERFYDLLHLNNDFRELDFKHNLEEKLKLIERAEKLAVEADINFAFKELQDLHKLWKEDIGPVAREYREDVWNKFSNITKKIHDRRHEYFKEQRLKNNKIIEAKEFVITEIESYDFSKNNTHKDWQNSIRHMEALRQKFFDAGKLPYNKSEDIWQKFKQATKRFNSAKNIFYKEEKRIQGDNLKRKMELVDIAEELKDSEDWENATNTMKRIQADWKKIGNVPRKFSDDIWKRFKDACNHYFDRLQDNKNSLNKEQEEAVGVKKEFLDAFKAKEGLSLEEIQETITEWKNLGSLPRNLRHIDSKFFKVVDSHLAKLNLNKQEIEEIKFKNVIENYLEQKDYRKIDSEQLFIRRKIDERVRDMQQLENNLSFISNASADNPLVKNVRSEIQKIKDELDVWQIKLDYLKTLEY